MKSSIDWCDFIGIGREIRTLNKQRKRRKKRRTSLHVRKNHHFFQFFFDLRAQTNPPMAEDNQPAPAADESIAIRVISQVCFCILFSSRFDLSSLSSQVVVEVQSQRQLSKYGNAIVQL
jgi:hypothetical protein